MGQGRGPGQQVHMVPGECRPPRRQRPTGHNQSTSFRLCQPLRPQVPSPQSPRPGLTGDGLWPSRARKSPLSLVCPRAPFLFPINQGPARSGRRKGTILSLCLGPTYATLKALLGLWRVFKPLAEAHSQEDSEQQGFGTNAAPLSIKSVPRGPLQKNGERDQLKRSGSGLNMDNSIARNRPLLRVY